jgi:hypothetical protein
MTDADFTTEELDAVVHLMESNGWRLVVGRVAQELDRTRDGLEREVDPTKAADLRGYARAMRTMLRIPEIYRDEIKIYLKEHPNAEIPSA